MPPYCLLWLFALLGVGLGLIRPPSEALNASIIEFRDAPSLAEDEEVTEGGSLGILPELQQPHPPSISPRILGERDVDPAGPPAPPIIVQSSFDKPEGRSVREDNETVSSVTRSDLSSW